MVVVMGAVVAPTRSRIGNDSGSVKALIKEGKESAEST